MRESSKFRAKQRQITRIVHRCHCLRLAALDERCRRFGGCRWACDGTTPLNISGYVQQRWNAPHSCCSGAELEPPLQQQVMPQFHIEPHQPPRQLQPPASAWMSWENQRAAPLWPPWQQQQPIRRAQQPRLRGWGGRNPRLGLPARYVGHKLHTPAHMSHTILKSRTRLPIAGDKP